MSLTQICSTGSLEKVNKYLTTETFTRLSKLERERILNTPEENSGIMTTPLIAACRSTASAKDKVVLLLNAGANPNLKVQKSEEVTDQETLWDVACLYGKVEIVEILLANKDVEKDLQIISKVKDQISNLEQLKATDQLPPILVERMPDFKRTVDLLEKELKPQKCLVM